MPKLSLAKLEQHLYSAADRLRQEGLDAAIYKDYIFGMLFLKRCSDVFDAEREKIVGTRVEQGMAKEKAEGYGEDPDYYDGFFVPGRARWMYLQDKLSDAREAYGSVLDKALGIPLVVAEFKSPGIQNPLQEAINQLLRYSNQRRELFPTLYTDNEGVERLFHTNQLLIASDFFEARAATIGAPPEAYLEWADASPVPMSTVAEELGIISSSRDEAEAEEELAALGPEQSECSGTPLFFRKPEQRPAVMRHNSAALRSQHILVAGMLRPRHLIDLVRNFTVFQQVDGKTRKVVARYQQFRAVHKAIERLQKGRTRRQGAVRDERGGIIWHTQGSGKSLSMVFLVRKMRMMQRLNRFKVVAVTDRTDLEDQLHETARLCGETLRPNDNDIMRRESPTARTQRLLRETTSDIVFAMLQKYQDVERPDGREKVALTIFRKEKKPGKDQPVVERKVTFEESIQFEEFHMLNESEDILVLVDEAHRSHTRTLHRNLGKALPNAAIIGFTGTPIVSHEKTETREIFGDFIDKYLLQDSELDGATVPILYEGRTADGLVKDAPGLDQLFEDMFQDYTADELTVKLEEILQRFKDDWDALERELRRFIDELKQGDRSDFPNLDPNVQVPFVRLVLEECSKGRELGEAQRSAAVAATLEMVERIRQEIRKVGFWKNQSMREFLTRILAREIDKAGICRAGAERDLAQRLVALAKENHENLTR